MSTIRRSVGARYAIVLALCVWHDARAQAPPRLTEVRRYGWEDVSNATRALSPTEQRLQGAVLGDITAAAEAPDGALYVLDDENLKIVVFNRDGTLRRVFGGVRGRGPGEFDRPRDLALAPNGELYVLDQTLSRVVVFDTAGTFRRILTLGTPSPLYVTATEERVYVTGPIRAGRPVVNAYDPRGRLLEQLFVPDAEGAEFGRAGEAYRLIALRNGTLVMAHPNPGFWAPLATGARTGRAVIANNRVVQSPRDPDVFIAPASVRGFAELSDGRLLAYYMQWTPESFVPNGRRGVDFKLALLSSSGALLSAIPIPASSPGRVFGLTRDRRDLLLSVSDPYPQLVRFSLTPAPPR